jgi:DNA-binding NarL/FixJ family response regulator
MHILIVDDHALFRAGIAALLRGTGEAVTVHEAGDAAQALALARELPLDLVLLDISMPPSHSGLVVLQDLKALQPQLPVLMLSAHVTLTYAQRALALGASGYLVKSVGPAELRLALEAVRAGRHHLSPEVASLLVEGARPALCAADPLVGLSVRQVEVLRLIAQGLSTKEIARELGLSPKTVDIHRGHLMQRVGLHEIAGLTRLAVRTGLVPVEA